MPQTVQSGLQGALWAGIRPGVGRKLRWRSLEYNGVRELLQECVPLGLQARREAIPLHPAACNSSPGSTQCRDTLQCYGFVPVLSVCHDATRICRMLTLPDTSL